jgi:hypothetical protein
MFNRWGLKGGGPTLRLHHRQSHAKEASFDDGKTLYSLRLISDMDG